MNTPPSKLQVAQAWQQLATSSRIAVRLIDDPSISIVNEATFQVWSNALAGIAEALQTIDHPGAPINWRNDPSRTRYRQHYDIRIQVSLIRHRRENGVYSQREAEYLLTELGLDAAGVSRILHQYIDPLAVSIAERIGEENGILVRRPELPRATPITGADHRDVRSRLIQRIKRVIGRRAAP